MPISISTPPNLQKRPHLDMGPLLRACFPARVSWQQVYDMGREKPGVNIGTREGGDEDGRRPKTVAVDSMSNLRRENRHQSI